MDVALPALHTGKYVSVASRNASTQKSVSMVTDSCHDRTRRLNQSITANKYKNSLAIGIYVMSAHQTGSPGRCSDHVTNMDKPCDPDGRLVLGFW